MQIAGLQKNSTIDFPGALAAVIFTAGCNLRCFYCHNRALLDAPPLLAEADVDAFLVKRAGLLSGVVFSGGEPTLQADLPDWLLRARALGYKTKLDTNGTRPQALAALLRAGLVDYVAMDYKVPFDRYASLCAAEPDGVAQSLALLARGDVPYELRTTLVPQLDAAALAQMGSALVDPAARWVLQLYREQAGDAAFLAGKTPYTPEAIRAFAAALAPQYPGVFARC